MNNYRLILQYDGGRYDGWQRMGKENADNTILKKISDVVLKMTGSEAEINCGCRTEKGVHAYGQVINIKTDASVKELELKNYLNRYLPRDIAVLHCEKADERFHAQLGVKSVTYVYRVDTGNVADVFERRYCYHVFDKLDMEAMRMAAAAFVGNHDYKAFTTAKRSKTTVKMVSDIHFEEKDNILTISITANDFMHNMARLMVGMLLDVGTGLKKPDAVTKALSGEDVTMSFPAEACGLFLKEITY